MTGKDVKTLGNFHNGSPKERTDVKTRLLANSLLIRSRYKNGSSSEYRYEVDLTGQITLGTASGVGTLKRRGL